MGRLNLSKLFLSAGLCCLLPRLSHAIDYKLHWLPSPECGAQSLNKLVPGYTQDHWSLNKINNLGEVQGQVFISNGESSEEERSEIEVPVVWTGGKIKEICPLSSCAGNPFFKNINVYDFNDSGYALGSIDNKGAAIFKDQKYTLIKTGQYESVVSLSDSNTITGYVQDGNRPPDELDKTPFLLWDVAGQKLSEPLNILFADYIKQRQLNLLGITSPPWELSRYRFGGTYVSSSNALSVLNVDGRSTWIHKTSGAYKFGNYKAAVVINPGLGIVQEILDDASSPYEEIDIFDANRNGIMLGHRPSDSLLLRESVLIHNGNVIGLKHFGYDFKAIKINDYGNIVGMANTRNYGVDDDYPLAEPVMWNLTGDVQLLRTLIPNIDLDWRRSEVIGMNNCGSGQILGNTFRDGTYIPFIVSPSDCPYQHPNYVTCDSNLPNPKATPTPASTPTRPTVDLCPNDPLKAHPGVCGCGKSDIDGNLNGTADCLENGPGGILLNRCVRNNPPLPETAEGINLSGKVTRVQAGKKKPRTVKGICVAYTATLNGKKIRMATLTGGTGNFKMRVPTDSKKASLKPAPISEHAYTPKKRSFTSLKEDMSDLNFSASPKSVASK